MNYKTLLIVAFYGMLNPLVPNAHLTDNLHHHLPHIEKIEPVPIKNNDQSPEDCSDINCKNNKPRAALAQESILNNLENSIDAQCTIPTNELNYLNAAKKEYASLFPSITPPPVVVNAEEKKSSGFLDSLITFFNPSPPPIPKEEEKNPQKMIHLNNTFCSDSDESQYIKELMGNEPPQNWLEKSKASCTVTKQFGSCIDAKCSTIIAYGSEEAALRVLSMAKKYGYAMSMNKTKIKPSSFNSGTYEPSDWSLKQLRIIDDALSRLPKNLLRLNTLKRMILFPEEQNAEQTSWYALAWLGNEEIRVMPKTFGNNPLGAKKTIIHEVAHFFDYEPSLNPPLYKSVVASSGFKELSGWNEENQIKKNNNGEPLLDKNGNLIMEKVWTTSPQAKFVTDYAKTNPIEDFAETLSDYIIEPENLLLRAPEKYDFMKKNIFANQEFLKNDQWPTFDRELNKLGGIEEIINSCMQNIISIDFSKSTGTEELVYWTRMEETPSRLDGTYHKYFFSDENKCLRDFTKKLTAALANDTQFCMQGGKKNISGLLTRKMYPLEKTLTAFKEHILQKGNSTTGLKTTIESAEGFSHFSSKTQSFLLEKFTSLTKAYVKPNSR